MTPLVNNLTKRADQPSFETLNTPPDANNINQAIASVASTAISDEIPPLRELSAAPPKIIQFLHGSRTVLQEGILVQVPNPAPPVKKTGIHTVRDLPPEEIPGLAELRKTIEESKELADKMEKLADDRERLGAYNRQLNDEATRLGVLAQEINADTRRIRADRNDLIQRVDTLEKKLSDIQNLANKETAKAAQQMAQLEILTRCYLDQKLENKTIALPLSQEPAPISISETNFLARNWKIIGGSVFCLITLVAVAAIFGIASMLLVSAPLVVGTACFGNQQGEKELPHEKFLLHPFLINDLVPQA